MGLNLHIEEHAACDNRYCRSTQPDWWDSDKYTGDRDFYLTDDLEWADLPGHHDQPGWRPADFQKARAWVMANIDAAGNRQRLLEAFDKMEANPNLWFYGSW